MRAANHLKGKFIELILRSRVELSSALSSRISPAHSMAQGPKQIGAYEVTYARGQECRTLFPSAGAHRIHHPDGQTGLEHGNAHVGECDCTLNVEHASL